MRGFFEVHHPLSMSRLVTFLSTVAAILVALLYPDEPTTVAALLGGSGLGLGLRSKADPPKPPQPKAKHPDADLCDDVP